MRLFLSSYGVGNQPDKLTGLVGDNKKTAIITNAGDHHTEQEIQERVGRDVILLAQLGLKAEQLDLREYFDKDPGAIKSKLSEYGLVWVRGGNAFVLRRAMAQSGFDKAIVSLLEDDQIAYGGYSAGACVLSPNLRGVDLCDDPTIVPKGYVEEIIWEGLGLIDFAIAPHYKSEHPETAMIDRVIEYFEHNKIAYNPLRDGEAIAINDGKVEFIQ